MTPIFLVRSQTSGDIIHILSVKPWHSMDPGLEIVEGVAYTNEEWDKMAKEIENLHSKIEFYRKLAHEKTESKEK